jgi:uncharacterized protein YfaP (DUF2135 family)
MDGNHNIYLQWMVIITSTYNGQLQLHLITMDGYHSFYLQWIVTVASTNDWLP